MPPRKIAYLLSQYPAVSHTFFLSEIAALRQRGFVIETASINPVSPPLDGFSAAETDASAQTFYLKSGSRALHLLRLLAITARHPLVVQRGIREALRLAPGNVPATLYALFYLAEALLLGAWMHRRGCQHLHVHFAGPVATVALLASVAWQMPFSLTVHGPDEFYDVTPFYLRRKLERASFVLCISDFCRSQLLRIGPPAFAGKLHVCRLGVDDALFLPVPRQPSPTTRLICVGRLHPSKGQEILLAAVLRLKVMGYSLHLDLVGGGPDQTRIEQTIAADGLSAEVTLHGATSHARTRTLLQQADLFVLASFAEGVPVALMEAMAMQIPCISTFVAGIPELIRPEVEGLLVPPASVDKLTQAIQSLLDDSALRHTLATAGRAKVLADYNLARNADHLADVLRAHGLG